MATKLFGTDPTFYPSARAAMEAPPERLGYVALIKPDALAVVDLDPASKTYSQVISKLEFPHGDADELHHFGWNACSSALCPTSPHPHLERQYLIVPGLRSSRVYIVDTKENPKHPKLVSTIEPEELQRRTGYSRPHTVHCGPNGIYMSGLGAAFSDEGPGGIFLLDHNSFKPLGRFEVTRGPQVMAYDFWWHIAHDVIVTSEWGLPAHFEKGLDVGALVERRFGHSLHFFDSRTRRHLQSVDLGDQHQMTLELRPAHDPTKLYGFVGVVTNVEDLSASIWVWHPASRSPEGATTPQEGAPFTATKIITIPAQAADPAQLPPILKPFGAVPPLVTDIALSLDDRFLYVSCWGTGELLQYDVSDPFNPKQTGMVRFGGIVNKTPHPNGTPIGGGPQMLEVSRDGRRVYVTNSLYASWDPQFYPDGIPGAMVKIDAAPGGGITIDPNFLTTFGQHGSHQVRLEGGDASSDSFCFA